MCDPPGQERRRTGESSVRMMMIGVLGRVDCWGHFAPIVRHDRLVFCTADGPCRRAQTPPHRVGPSRWSRRTALRVGRDGKAARRTTGQTWRELASVSQCMRKCSARQEVSKGMCSVGAYQTGSVWHIFPSWETKWTLSHYLTGAVRFQNSHT